MRGGCLICGNNEPRNLPHGKEVILTTNYQDEFAGTVEFCQSCIEEVGAIVGMVSARKYARTESAAKTAQGAVKELTETLKDKDATIRVLTKELNTVPAA